MIYDPTRKWVTPLTNITFPNDNEHGIYLKVSSPDDVSTAEWIVSEPHIDPLRDDDRIIYKLGRALAVVDGVREVRMLWGNVKQKTGQAAYVYIAYASDAAGTGFTMTFNPALKYVAIKNTALPIAVPVVGDFAGLWTKYVGENGETGAPGAQPLQVSGITLIAANWTLVTGLYEYDLANVNITATSIVDIIPENASIAIVKAAEVLPMTVSSTGSVKLYSTNAPTGDISVTLNITEATI